MHAWGHRDLVGLRFGRLVVQSFEGKRGHQRLWLCLCDCGKQVLHTTHHLVKDVAKSCGCLHREQLESGALTRKHGATIGGEDRLYRIWKGMKARCYIKCTTSYKYYGARGIQVCDEWLFNYPVFAAWAKTHGYSDELTIDRIDNDGDYTPDNCRWVTMAEQNRNKRGGKFTTIGDRQVNLAGLCKEYNISVSLVRARISRGWDLERALTEPAIKYELSELAKANGVNRHALYARLKAGWELETALQTPVRKWTKQEDNHE